MQPGEWNKKGETLSDVTAQAEYGVNREFIVRGIRSGRLEYREGSMYGNPYFRLLKSQLEQYISDELGKDYLTKARNGSELRKINKEISSIGKRLKVLQLRKIELEKLGPSAVRRKNISVGRTIDDVYRTLHAIYDRHRRRYRKNPDSGQMCCMWSTDNPPDGLVGTRPLHDIEDAFDIRIDEDAALDLYDLELKEAAQRIHLMIGR